MSNDPVPEQFDVLVIGGGAAGLYTALSLPTTLRIALITKDTLKQSASDWAQGGIAAAMREDDSPDLHARDTFLAGAGLCEPDAVQFLVNHAKAQITNLLEMGVSFDRQQQQLAFTLEAAHSRPRVLHSADATGKALIKTLTNQVFLQQNIKVLEEFFSVDLLTHPQSGRCYGVTGIFKGKFCHLWSKAVVLATGGGGQVFSQTTNPELSTGDGVAMAWRAGAIVRDLEFFQFHPTALKVSGAPRFLISEAVRGEGAHLLDHNGDRFMSAYHELGELAPRDIVSQSIIAHLSDSQQDNVWLDLRPIPADKIQYRFPKIIRVCKFWGIDVFRQPIPVAPAAHYWMGGVQTDLNAKTSIDGLYAVGEVASTGVHGANRLASNSLMECLVFGAALADAVSRDLKNLHLHNAISFQDPMPTLESGLFPSDDLSTCLAIRLELADCMWQFAGITRDYEGLTSGIEMVQRLQKSLGLSSNALSSKRCDLNAFRSLNARLTDLNHVRVCGETRNLLHVSSLILKSALFRCESRGGHFRSDFPQLDPTWLVHSVIEGDKIRCEKLEKS